MAEKTDVSTFNKDYKKLPRNIVIKEPPLRKENVNCLGVYYGTCESLPIVAKCYDRSTFTPSSQINNCFHILMGNSAKLVLTRSHRYYVAPFCNAGNLKDLVDKGVVFSEKQIASFILQVSQQLSKLMEIGLYHGELCPEHILINYEKNYGYTYKICGLGRWRVKSPEYYKSESIRSYLDPRVIDDPTKEYDYTCDIWSLGILVYKLVTGSFPVIKKNQKVMLGLDYDYIPHSSSNPISPMLNYLCSRCLLKDPLRRILPDNIPSQPFFIPVRKDMKRYVKCEDTPLGAGASCTVFPAYLKSNPNKRYAMKILEAANKANYQQLATVFGEICIFRMLKDSAYTVKLIDNFEYENKVYLILELLNGGNLEDYWNKYISKVDAKEIDAEVANMEMLEVIWQVTHTLANAIRDMHIKSIIHRDIKPANILINLDKKTNRIASVSLSDFGVSKEMMMPEGVATTLIGTPHYMAMEVLSGEYDFRADIFSFGRVLHKLAYGVPFIPPQETRDPWFSVPECYLQLTKACCSREANERPEIKKVIDCGYLKEAPCISLNKFPSTYELGKMLANNETYSIREITYIPTKTKLLVKILKDAFNLPRDEIGEGIKSLIVLRKSNDIYRMHQSFIFKNDYYFILDYTERNTLKDLIEEEKKLKPEYVKKFALELARAIYDIHAVKLEHGRICADYLYLVDDEESKSLSVKLLYDEAIQSVSDLEARADSANDIYKFGEVLYHMLFGSTEDYPNCVHSDVREEHAMRLDSAEMKSAFELVYKCVSMSYYHYAELLKDEYFADDSNE